MDDLIERFAESGADLISFHPEASNHVHRSIQKIKDYGCKAGLVFNPKPLSLIEDFTRRVDLVLLMSVNPGFGGQEVYFKGNAKNKKTTKK